MPELDETTYARIASRSIALGQLQVLMETLDSFRVNAESGGIAVNSDVIEIRAKLFNIGEQIYEAAWNDKRAIVSRYKVDV